ncbi:Small GTP-binding domain containing protein [Parasponia andersonii]|uniref:Small GTP-binding domain containing protein n=1 Tax=Parasponia andersonii TaxID=3476 RepID=A0A2P5CUF8_PARAD|nr:Small GTP-binding domain containing protein [Parasponia andersonii]
MNYSVSGCVGISFLVRMALVVSQLDLDVYRFRNCELNRDRVGCCKVFLFDVKYMFSKTEFHVLILGIDKAGKTTLLEKLKSVYSNLEGLPPDRIVPTVGLNIGRIEVSNTKLVFWDLGGQPGLRSIWEKYYEEAHAIIFVIDAACPSRFEDSKSALEKVLRHEDLQGAPLLVLANKQDLAESVSAEELARYLDLKKLDERVYMLEAVSSYDGLGIKEGVEWLVEVMERSMRTEMLGARIGPASV